MIDMTDAFTDPVENGHIELNKISAIGLQANDKSLAG